MQKRYKIIRTYFKGNRIVNLKRGLTLDEAIEHMSSIEAHCLNKRYASMTSGMLSLFWERGPWVDEMAEDNVMTPKETKLTSRKKRIRMEARRYCGEVNIYIRLRPDMNGYNVSVKPEKAQARKLTIGIANHISEAIDSPNTYDGVAKAAMSFAADMDERKVNNRDYDVEAHAALNEDGWVIRRQK